MCFHFFNRYQISLIVPHLSENRYTAITALMLKGAGGNNTETKADLEPSANSEPQINPKSPELIQIETSEQILAELAEESSELPVELLKSSFEKIKPHANEFAASFYENLFKTHPEVKPLFSNTDMGNQEKKLLNSLILVVENLRNPEALEPVLKALGGRHVGYGAIPKYYQPVGEALLVTFEQYLQDDWNPQVKKAWLDAFRAITALMLKGANEASLPKVVLTQKAATLAPSSTLKTENQKESQLFDSTVKPEKKGLISINLDSEIFKEIITGFTERYQQFQTKISEQPLSEVLKQVSIKLIDAFWIAPAWLVAIIAAVVFTVVLLIVDDNSWFSEILGAVDTISLVVALVLFIKEAPDRRKQFHYQAWSIVDAAHNVKVSYARILALQDLNEEVLI